MRFYLRCFGRAWRETREEFGLGPKAIMRILFVWAVSVMVLWVTPWPWWMPGEPDMGNEMKLALSGVLGIIASFLAFLCINFLAAPPKLYREISREKSALEDKLRPRLRLARNIEKPEAINSGVVDYEFFGGGIAQITAGYPREIIFAECINNSGIRIDGCRADITDVKLKNPESNFKRFVEAHNGEPPKIVDNIPLRWLPVSSGNELECVSIPSAGRRRLEVLAKNGTYLQFCTEVRPIHYIVFFKQGFEYLLDISVTCESAGPLFIRAHVAWGEEGVRCSFTERDKSEELPEMLDVA